MHNLNGICVEEQKTMKGGDGEKPTLFGTLPEIVIVGERTYPHLNYWGGLSFNNGDNCFNSGDEVNRFVYGSTQGTDQIWNQFRGWTGSDFYIAGSDTSEIGNTPPVVLNNRCNISQDGLDFMKSWEKAPGKLVVPALKPYDDGAGNMTIGWGHLIKPGENFNAGISVERANSIFLAYLQKAINDVNNSVHVSLTQSQFDALVDYSFNIGGLNASPECLRLLNSGDYTGAAAQMDIVTSNGQALPGLVTRRTDERTIFNDGLYYCH